MNRESPPQPFEGNTARADHDAAHDAVRKNPGQGFSEQSAASSRLPIDPWRLVDVLFRRWHWILLGGIGLAIVGFIWGFFTARCTAAVTLTRNEGPAAISFGAGNESVILREDTVQTFVDVMRSPDLLRRVVVALGKSITADQIARDSDVSPVQDTDLVRLRVRGRNPRPTIHLVNIYAQEVAFYSRRLQSDEAAQINNFLKEELTAVDKGLASANRELIEFQRAADVSDLDKELSGYLEQRVDLDSKSEDIRVQLETLDLQISALAQEISQQHPGLLSAKQELDRALLRYTEEHPRVRALRTNVAAIEAQIAEHPNQIDPDIALHGSSLAQSLYAKVVELRTQKIALGKQLEGLDALRTRLQERLAALPEKRSEYIKVRSRYESLKNTRALLAGRQQEAELLAANAPGYYRILADANVENLTPAPKLKEGLFLGLGAGALGGLVICILLMGLEAADGRIRSEEDLTRVTKLKILATLGDLSQMTSEEREQWAFKTLIALKGRLSAPKNQAMVIGFTCSGPGEGRSTWVNLLAESAGKQGHQVFTIFAHRSCPDGLSGVHTAQLAEEVPGFTTLSAALESPKALMATRSRNVVDVPVSGWAWNLERRNQWQAALQKLDSIENLIVFVELPPASEPEAVLLSENLSHLIWLCGNDMADRTETRSQLEMLRNVRSHLVGAVFNRAAAPLWRKRFGRWIGAAPVIAALISGDLTAQEAKSAVVAQEPQKTNAVASYSLSSPVQLADWQKRLTLGPGDVIQVSMYEQADSLRVGLTIGPDGRLNYLQARDVIASGLTVDELREKLENVLEKYYRPPVRVTIIPEAYRSKKYYLLGNVVQKGVFALDRPITIIEAIARAKGFATSIQQRNTLMQADLSRSFWIRKESEDAFKRVDVDFEALFLRGDLSQNKTLAPDDYLYFPPLDLQEIYVLGEVRLPGVTPFTPDVTALRAIVTRGGFTDKAYKKKLLVVRGSLTRPQTFVVNASDILAAKTPDFQLQARDIVYVNRSPWSKVEDLLQAAGSDFIRAVVISWTGRNVGPIINNPFVPNIK